LVTTDLDGSKAAIEVITGSGLAVTPPGQTVKRSVSGVRRTAS
jgi:hypothetical protein